MYGTGTILLHIAATIQRIPTVEAQCRQDYLKQASTHEQGAIRGAALNMSLWKNDREEAGNISNMRAGER